MAAQSKHEWVLSNDRFEKFARMQKLSVHFPTPFHLVKEQ
jgi:hypothetical protein